MTTDKLAQGTEIAKTIKHRRERTATLRKMLTEPQDSGTEHYNIRRHLNECLESDVTTHELRIIAILALALAEGRLKEDVSRFESL